MSELFQTFISSPSCWTKGVWCFSWENWAQSSKEFPTVWSENQWPLTLMENALQTHIHALMQTNTRCLGLSRVVGQPLQDDRDTVHNKPWILQKPSTHRAQTEFKILQRYSDREIRLDSLTPLCPPYLFSALFFFSVSLCVCLESRRQSWQGSPPEKTRVQRSANIGTKALKRIMFSSTEVTHFAANIKGRSDNVRANKDMRSHACTTAHKHACTHTLSIRRQERGKGKETVVERGKTSIRQVHL